MYKHGRHYVLKTWGTVVVAFVVGACLSVLTDGSRASNSNEDGSVVLERKIIESLLQHGARIRHAEIDGKWSKGVILDPEWSGDAADIRSIAELASVRELILNCRLSPDAIDGLSRCRDLSLINVSDSGLTDSDKKRMQAACPAAEIYDCASRVRALVYGDDDGNETANSGNPQ